MYSKLFLPLCLLFAGALFAQEVEIAGDTMLCPNSNGTASVVNDISIDSYQWLVRDAFTSDQFTPITGATNPTFTYSAFDYSVKEIRLGAVVLGDVYIESNILLIDSWVFSGITTMTEDDPDLSINPNDGSLLLCQGGAFNISVMMPYNSNIQWYKDGAPIAENTTTLEVTAPGDYYVTAAPQVCPNFSQTSLPISVSFDPDCQLGLIKPERNMTSVFPNPAGQLVQFRSDYAISKAEVMNMSGQVMITAIQQTPSGSVDVSGLASGIYILNLSSQTGTEHFRIIKE